MKFATACTFALVASASAFAPAPSVSRSTELKMSLKDDLANVGKVALAGAVAVGIAAAPANALTKSQINELSYLQVKGTGLANRCPEVVGEDSISPKSGQKLVDMCIEPKAWAVEEEIGKGGKTEKKFVNSKVMTRQTYTLDVLRESLIFLEETLSSLRRRELTTPPPLSSFQEENVFHSFSPSRILLPREAAAPSSLDSRWEETSTLPLTVQVSSLTPKDVVEQLDTIWLSLCQVFNPERKVTMSFSPKTTRSLILQQDVSKWKSTRSTLRNRKLEEFSLLLNFLILIWVLRCQRRSSPRESSTPESSK
jgi:hypothetical protein